MPDFVGRKGVALADGTDATDAATKGQMDTALAAKLTASGFASPSQTINAGDSASGGAATTALRSDAQFAVATAAASTISGTNSEGSSTSLARADHNHALPSLGTVFGVKSVMASPASAAQTANQIYLARIVIPSSATITGVQYRVGATSNGNVRSALYNSNGNTRHAVRTTDSAMPAANAVHQVAFDATYAAAPGEYIIALLFSSSTGTAQACGCISSGSAANGSMTVPATVTPPTSGALVVIPVMTTY